MGLAFRRERADEYAGGCSQRHVMNINIRNPGHLEVAFCKDCGVHKVSLKLGWCVMTIHMESAINCTLEPGVGNALSLCDCFL